MSQAIEKTKSVTQEILASMGLVASVVVEKIGGEDAIEVDSADQALLIGRGGENLRAFQYLVHQIVKKSLPEAGVVTVDVAGYRKGRLRKLEVMVELAKSQAKDSSSEVSLAPMNAYERRYVHSLITQDDQFTSQSSGNEPDRRVIIRLAN